MDIQKLNVTGKNLLLRKVKMENKDKKEGILFVPNAKQVTQIYQIVEVGDQLDDHMDIDTLVYIKGYPTIIETLEETFYVVNENDIIGFMS